ncbi:MAG: DUF3164 family protein [Rhizobiales bacterium]|nr:DUF3164 family protein [Hyphomicrobiales bacterium]
MSMQTETLAAASLVDPETPGIIYIGGKPMMEDTKGRLVPVANVRPADKLQDQTVRKMIEFARDLSAQIARFKGHCYDDIGSLQALIAEQYGASIGGAKGNISLSTYDGRLKVTLQVADQLSFGPELQAAKKLVDACLAEWTAGSSDNLVAVVNRAFQVDKEGLVNRAELFMLLRVEVDDPRWQAAMDAVRDSIRVIGSKTYIRFHERDAAGGWRPITIDLAAA